MTTLVTGAVGFVPSNVVRCLAQRGEPVVGVDIVPPDDLARAHVAGLPGEVTWRQVDLADAAAVRALVEATRPARVVHAAAMTSIRFDTERARFVRTVEVNVLGTLRLLEALRDVGTGRIVVVSSGSIYGPRADRRPVTEDDPPDPRGVYPLSKWAAEALARRFGEVEGLDLAVVRLAGPYGPMERDTGSRPLLSVLTTWAQAAVRGEPAVVRGPLDQRRDAIHVEDIASGIAAVLLAERLPHRTYNVGLGEDVSYEAILATLGRLVLGFRFEQEPLGSATDANPVRGPLASDRLRGDLGWAPRYDLESGLAAYVSWLKQNEPVA